MIEKWYSRAAIHIFRHFYRFKSEGKEPTSRSARKTFRLCAEALTGFSEPERRFLERYFLSEWGHDRETVSSIAAATGTPENDLWDLIRRANRRLFEAAGLIEPND